MLKGKQLRNMRQLKDIKAKYIAEKLGVTGSYICNLEKERQDIPDRIYKQWVEILKGDA